MKVLGLLCAIVLLNSLNLSGQDLILRVNRLGINNIIEEELTDTVLQNPESNSRTFGYLWNLGYKSSIIEGLDFVVRMGHERFLWNREFKQATLNPSNLTRQEVNIQIKRDYLTWSLGVGSELLNQNRITISYLLESPWSLKIKDSFTNNHLFYDSLGLQEGRVFSEISDPMETTIGLGLNLGFNYLLSNHFSIGIDTGYFLNYAWINDDSLSSLEVYDMNNELVSTREVSYDISAQNFYLRRTFNLKVIYHLKQLN